MDYVDQVKRAELDLQFKCLFKENWNVPYIYITILLEVNGLLKYETPSELWSLLWPFAKMVCVAECDQLTNSQ